MNMGQLKLVLMQIKHGREITGITFEVIGTAF